MANGENSGLRRSALREREGEGGRSRAVQDVRLSGRLDGLHLLHNRHGGDTLDKPCGQGVLRLLGVQDSGLLAVAGEQNAKIAVRLAVRDVIGRERLRAKRTLVFKFAIILCFKR